MEDTYNIDPGQIYATGVSNGDKMSLRLACEASDLLAGIASVIAALPTDLECRPAKPVSIMLMNGTEDPLVPYGGGQVHFVRQDLGAALSTPETEIFWVDTNHCSPTPADEYLPDLDPDDGTRIRREAYSECDAGAQVVLYEVQGGDIPGRVEASTHRVS